MTVMVKSSPKSGQSTGDWVVAVNGSHVSRHRKKSVAKRKARKRAKKRGDVLKVQKSNGRFGEVTSYD